MADGDFPIGSVVVLKSGGPKMTVVKHDKDEDDDGDTFTHQVIWFETSNPALAMAGGVEHYTGQPTTRFLPALALKLVE